MITILTSRNRSTSGTKAAPATGVVSTSGDNTVIAAPGVGFRVIVEGWQWQATADGDQVVLLKIGVIIFDGVVVATKVQGMRSTDVEYVGAENSAVILNLAAAVNGRFFIWYRVEPVD